MDIYIYIWPKSKPNWNIIAIQYEACLNTEHKSLLHFIDNQLAVDCRYEGL